MPKDKVYRSPTNVGLHCRLPALLINALIVGPECASSSRGLVYRDPGIAEALPKSSPSGSLCTPPGKGFPTNISRDGL